MATAASNTRAPRGTKILVQAFFAAADEIPEINRGAVVRAALTAIRDGLKADREKVAAAKTKGKTTIKAAPKKIGRPKGSKNKPAKVVRLTTRRKSVTTQRGRKAAAKWAPKQAPKAMAA
jgi:hypothetical protein